MDGREVTEERTARAGARDGEGREEERQRRSAEGGRR